MVGLAVAAAAGCGGAGAGPREPSVGPAAAASDLGGARPPFATPGERMINRLTMHGMDVATFTIAIGDVTELDGRPVVVIQSGVRSSSLVSMVRQVNDSFTSWVEISTSRPVLFRSEELASPEDGALETSDSEAWRIEDGTFPIRVHRPEHGELVERQAVGTNPLYDMNGFLMTLRGWDVPVGTRATADVIRSRFLWRSEIEMAAYEVAVTDLGELPAVRIEGSSRRLLRDGQLDPRSDVRRYTMWISDDADRVPLRMVAHTDYGALEMSIVDYAPGTGRRLGAP
jgi:hypothetical protein